MDKSSLWKLGHKAGELVRAYTVCVVEFLEGFKEGTGDLKEIQKALDESLKKD